jgi:hypothetical protein
MENGTTTLSMLGFSDYSFKLIQRSTQFFIAKYTYKACITYWFFGQVSILKKKLMSSYKTVVIASNNY